VSIFERRIALHAAEIEKENFWFLCLGGTVFLWKNGGFWYQHCSFFKGTLFFGNVRNAK
jgi:hypothetical protein